MYMRTAVPATPRTRCQRCGRYIPEERQARHAEYCSEQCMRAANYQRKKQQN